jgi:hypothetical protein
MPFKGSRSDSFLNSGCAVMPMYEDNPFIKKIVPNDSKLHANYI